MGQQIKSSNIVHSFITYSNPSNQKLAIRNVKSIFMFIKIIFHIKKTVLFS